ncbi:MAG: ATP-binding protein, partial [Rudaea sp.]
ALQRLQGASERLGDAWREHGSWEFLRGDERAFDLLIDPFGRRRLHRGEPPPPPHGPQLHDAGPRDEGPPPRPDGIGDDAVGPSPERAPAPFDLRSRMLLTDAQGRPVVGDGRIPRQSSQLPIEVDGKQVGTLYLRPPPQLLGGLDQTFATAQWRDARIAGTVALIVALLFAYALARWLLAPVRALATGLHGLSAGDFDRRIARASSDELGELARDFNHLAQTLGNHRDARRRWGADIAHELRTPLSILRGEIAALQDGVRDASPAALESLQAECIRLSSLIEDLYQLALADAGALEYRFETVDLVALAREAVDLQTRGCADANLSLELLAPKTPVAVRGDARRLAQLLDNILANARRYTDAPGRIRVGIAQGSTQSRITIDDSAPGVPDVALPHLFDRLYRVEESRSRSAGGAGLGLAICHAIVTAHAGEIAAMASPLGGLRITIDLPSSTNPP